MDEITDWKDRLTNALREQHKVLFDYEAKGLKPEYAEYISCPACGSSSSSLWFEKDWFRHVRCANCSMVYMNPRMNREATHAFYNSNANAIYNEIKFDKAPASTSRDDKINLDNLRLLNQVRNGVRGALLEIGSAKGYFLSKAKEAGYAIYGLELNQVNYEYSRRLLGNTILDKDLLDANFENGRFDVVYMRDVIEHIPDPAAFLREVNRVLKPGGMVFLDTHNVDGWIYKIARERHTVFFGFEHPNHWSPRTLGLVLLQNGFVVRVVKQASLDFTASSILKYLTTSGFTTVYPKSISSVLRVPSNFLRKLLNVKAVQWLDQHTLPHIANFFGHGSTMKMIAQKEG
jgi:2-polyprenyl-3-methyl-5-hydroxy-6-metoxy-1,4-benzoquinol methylase